MNKKTKNCQDVNYLARVDGEQGEPSQGKGLQKEN